MVLQVHLFAYLHQIDVFLTCHTHLVSTMGHVPKSQYIEIQNLESSPFSNTDWVWTKDVRHGGAHIIKIKCAYIPHAQILKFLNGEHSHEDFPMEWNIYMQIPSQGDIKMLWIQNHLGHIWYGYSFLLCIDLFMSLYTTLSIEIDGTFCKYARGYGLEGNCGYPNHNRSISQNYLIQFSIRQLYTQLEVAKINFYHWPRTWINGEPTHNKHDLDSIAQSFIFYLRMSQVFNNHISTQLGLDYTIKQKYDTHKEIWWDKSRYRKVHDERWFH
jgi:hypothetical protein